MSRAEFVSRGGGVGSGAELHFKAVNVNLELLQHQQLRLKLRQSPIVPTDGDPSFIKSPLFFLCQRAVEPVTEGAIRL